MVADKDPIEKNMAESQVENATYNETTYNETQNDRAMVIEHVEGEIWSGINRQTILAFFVSLGPDKQGNEEDTRWAANGKYVF